MGYILSSKKFGVTAGTAIPEARKYGGCNLIPDGTNAASVIVYKGGAATDGNQVGGARAPATQNAVDQLTEPGDLDVGTPPPTVTGLFVVVTGTNAVAIVRYST